MGSKTTEVWRDAHQSLWMNHFRRKAMKVPSWASFSPSIWRAGFDSLPRSSPKGFRSCRGCEEHLGVHRAGCLLRVVPEHVYTQFMQLLWEDRVCWPCSLDILLCFLLTWFDRITSHTGLFWEAGLMLKALGWELGKRVFDSTTNWLGDPWPVTQPLWASGSSD